MVRGSASPVKRWARRCLSPRPSNGGRVDVVATTAGASRRWARLILVLLLPVPRPAWFWWRRRLVHIPHPRVLVLCRAGATTAGKFAAETAASAVVTASIRWVSASSESPSVRTFSAPLVSRLRAACVFVAARPAAVWSLSFGASGVLFFVAALTIGPIRVRRDALGTRRYVSGGVPRRVERRWDFLLRDAAGLRTGFGLAKDPCKY